LSQPKASPRPTYRSAFAPPHAKIADYFEDHYFAHGHTYEAHPMTLGPAVATIEEMQRLNLVERSASLEPYVRAKLEALKDKHPSIGDVRGWASSGRWS
jgi:taurine--2-oxoglutarate transaminase